MLHDKGQFEEVEKVIDEYFYEQSLYHKQT